MKDRNGDQSTVALIHGGSRISYDTYDEGRTVIDDHHSDGKIDGDTSDKNIHTQRDYHAINGGTHVIESVEKCYESDTQNDNGFILFEETGKDDGANSDDALGEKSTFCGMAGIGRSDKITLFLMIMVSFISSAAFSLLGPFLPAEGAKRGISQLEVGFIFSLQALVQTVTSPIFGYFIPRLGVKETLSAGILVEAVGNIWFGLSVLIKSLPWFRTCLYISRTMVGVGVGAVLTSTVAVSINTFPDNVGRVAGMIETACGTGILLGPTLGGMLYELGGFMLPFVFVGCVDLVSLLICIIVLRVKDGGIPESGSLIELMRIPMVWVFCLSVFVSGTLIAFLLPTLADRAALFTNNAIVAGLFFMLPSTFYVISSLIGGWAGEAFQITRPLLIGGMTFSAVGFLLMGPSPIFHLPPTLWLLCVSLIVAGAGDGASLINAFTEIYTSAVKNGMPDDMRTHGVVSGVYGCFHAMGTVVSPVIAGGYLYQKLGFAKTTSILAGVTLVVLLLVVIASLLEIRTSNGETKSADKEKGSEAIQLSTKHLSPATKAYLQQPDDNNATDD